jgi:hypothetical protein
MMVSIKIADPEKGGRRKRHIPLWYHGCAFPIFLFVLIMLNIFDFVIPFLGAIFGIMYFFYIQKGKSTEEFDQPLAFLKNFKLSDIGPLFRAIIVWPLIAIGIFAPFRAIFWGFILIFGWTEAWTRNFPEIPGFNAVFGLCGVILGITVGSLVWIRGLRLKSQLTNLPTSTVGSVAIGLSELRGTAQPCVEEVENEENISGKERSMQEKSNAIPILLNTNQIGAEGKVTGKTICSHFYLQDDTGRILVDPTGVEFWDGSGNFLWSPIRSIYLEKHYSEEIMPWKSTSMLLPGDSVYVIGNVEGKKDASFEASDSDRLVIRPASGLEDTSFFKRLLFGPKTKDKGSDIYNVFFLTDVTELTAAELLARSLKNVWIWMLVWIVLSLTLVFY